MQCNAMQDDFPEIIFHARQLVNLENSKGNETISC